MRKGDQNLFRHITKIDKETLDLQCKISKKINNILIIIKAERKTKNQGKDF